MRTRSDLVPRWGAARHGDETTIMDVWPSMFRDIRDFGWSRLPDLFGDDHVRVEEFREGDDLVVRLDLPGVDPEKDVEITADNGVLNVRAERHQSDQMAGRDFYRSEVRYGTVERSLPLPAGASADDVKATYADGVLELRVAVTHGGTETTTRVPVTRA